MKATTTLRRGARGFSLIELSVAMGVTVILMAGVFSAMSQAMRANESAKLMTGMNNDLRVAMDLLVRDLIQTGQGLPTGNEIQIPNDVGAAAIVRPGPAAMTFAIQPALPAVTVGASGGDTVNSIATDMITILMADGSFDQVALRAVNANASNGSIVVAMPAIIGGIDIDADPSTRIRTGDLIMLTKGSGSCLMHVTAVDGPNQTITFASGDSMNLNQFDVLDADDTTDEMLGTMNQIVQTAPVDPTAASTNALGAPIVAGARATRIRMITYYIDGDANARYPVLMRVINNRTPTIVGMALENLRLTYDIVNTTTNPTNVRMTATDLAGGGACGTDPCMPGQIMKVNVILAARSRENMTFNRKPYRNTLFTQVSLRSLAFVDRYQ